MSDQFFNGLENPKYPHLIRPGGGLAGEIFDLREDISRGFDRVDVSVSDPDAQESTWAAIEAGTPVAVLSELTTVNKAANPGV